MKDVSNRGKTTSGPDKFPMGLACYGRSSANPQKTTSCCETAKLRCTSVSG